MTTPELAAPVRLIAAYAAWVWTPVSCYLEQTTWRHDHTVGPTLYAKLGRTGAYPGLAAEAARARWARPYLSVPGVVATGTHGSLEWLVTTCLPGLPATDPILGEPATIVVALAEGLRRLHDRVPAQHCPFQFRLPVALDHVRRRAAAGHIDPVEDFDDDHRHLDLETALRELERLRPDDEDPVVCHGDYCPPNALLTHGQVTGYVDLGELGVADPGGTSPSPPAPSPATTAPASKTSSSTPTARNPTSAARPSTASSTTSPPDRITRR
jgi:aminoglycoside phosphotransferase